MDYKSLESIIQNKNRVCIFGMGFIGRIWAYHILKSAGAEIIGFCDNYNKSEELYGIPRIEYKDLLKQKEYCLLFIAARTVFQEQIMRQIRKDGFENYYLLDDSFIQKLFFSIDKAPIDVKKRYFEIYDDSAYLKKTFNFYMDRTLDLDNPKTYNEKIQWLKVHEHNREYIDLVDKNAVKKIVEKKIGKEYVIPTFAVAKQIGDIRFKEIKQPFVVKCTHDSGSSRVFNDFKETQQSSVKNHFDYCLSRNFYVETREWPYKEISPAIIVEPKLMAQGGVIDYKLFCFNGVVDNIMVVRGREQGNPKYFHFDTNWKLLRFNRLGRSLPDGYTEKKPLFIDEMISIAEILSKGIPHVRIDLYEANGKVYFGEYTFYSYGGYETGYDEKSDVYLGSRITVI